MRHALSVDLHTSCPPPPLNDGSSASNFETLISAVWPSSDEVRLRLRLKVIGWISDTDISLSSDITEATFSSADPLRDTHNSPNLTFWIFKTPFKVLLSLFYFYILLMKKQILFFFFLPSRMPAARGVNGLPSSRPSLFEFPCFVLR